MIQDSEEQQPPEPAETPAPDAEPASADQPPATEESPMQESSVEVSPSSPPREEGKGEVIDDAAVTMTPSPSPPHEGESVKAKAISLLPLALQSRLARKAKKLEKIMNFARGKGRVTNDDVQKLVGASDRTAQRYLKELERQGKLKATGKAGRYTHYLPA